MNLYTDNVINNNNNLGTITADDAVTSSKFQTYLIESIFKGLKRKERPSKKLNKNCIISLTKF